MVVKCTNLGIHCLLRERSERRPWYCTLGTISVVRRCGRPLALPSLRASSMQNMPYCACWMQSDLQLWRQPLQELCSRGKYLSLVENHILLNSPPLAFLLSLLEYILIWLCVKSICGYSNDIVLKPVAMSQPLPHDFKQPLKYLQAVYFLILSSRLENVWRFIVPHSPKVILL